MKYFIYRLSDGLPLSGQCATPDAQGHVPQITDYTTYGVVEIADDAPDLDPATERVDVALPSKRRPVTDADRAALKVAETQAELDRFGVTDALRAVVWVVLRHMFPSDTIAQTKTKFNNAARPQIVDAYKTKPWL